MFWRPSLPYGRMTPNSFAVGTGMRFLFTPPSPLLIKGKAPLLLRENPPPCHDMPPALPYDHAPHAKFCHTHIANDRPPPRRRDVVRTTTLSDQRRQRPLAPSPRRGGPAKTISSPLRHRGVPAEEAGPDGIGERRCAQQCRRRLGDPLNSPELAGTLGGGSGVRVTAKVGQMSSATTTNTTVVPLLLTSSGNGSIATSY